MESLPYEQSIILRSIIDHLKKISLNDPLLLNRLFSGAIHLEIKHYIEKKQWSFDDTRDVDTYEIINFTIRYRQASSAFCLWKESKDLFLDNRLALSIYSRLLSIVKNLVSKDCLSLDCERSDRIFRKVKENNLRCLRKLDKTSQSAVIKEILNRFSSVINNFPLLNPISLQPFTVFDNQFANETQVGKGCLSAFMGNLSAEKKRYR